LIVNDRADTLLIDADGVHLGQHDLSVPQARAVVGPGKIIGLSTHNLLQVSAAARTEGVDYIGYGPIFPTGSKENPDPVQGLDGLRAVRASCSIPIVAIGGISAVTMPAVLEAGADAVAMIGEIVRARDVEAKVRCLLGV
jgi:thiamine-phosphate pyrophosphorylase